MLYKTLDINEKGHLTFAGRDTAALAEKYGTPAYIMDEETIRSRCREYKTAMAENFGGASYPLFAGKALCIKSVYRVMREEGMGVDVASPGELNTVYRAGFPMEKVFFHGNNKTDADIAFAMERGTGYFVCDNADELKAIGRIASEKGLRQKILLRVTPGIDPHTHAKINTGRVDSKFGAAIETGSAEELTGLALSLDGVELTGFHCHVGSQIFDFAPFADAAKIMLGFITDMKNRFGYAADILDLGGGMGVPYMVNDPKIDYAANIKGIADVIKAQCAELGTDLPVILMEPGRSIVADAGITLYTVGGRKEIPGFRNYVSVDGGMADNPRYTLYEAKYTVYTANRMNEPADYECTVAGRCCESGDLIGEGIKLAKPVRGDILAVMTTGAYNYSMASNYNCLPKPPVIMLTKNGEYVAVRRETCDDLLLGQSD